MNHPNSLAMDDVSEERIGWLFVVLVGTGTLFSFKLENGNATVEIGKTLAVIQALGLELIVLSLWKNK